MIRDNLNLISLEAKHMILAWIKNSLVVRAEKVKVGYIKRFILYLAN